MKGDDYQGYTVQLDSYFHDDVFNDVVLFQCEVAIPNTEYIHMQKMLYHPGNPFLFGGNSIPDITSIIGRVGILIPIPKVSVFFSSTYY